MSESLLNKQNLLKAAHTKMPFGRFSGRYLIDLPEEYLMWFEKKGAFPEGKLGKLMQLCLTLKLEGLESLIKPLRPTDP